MKYEDKEKENNYRLDDSHRLEDSSNNNNYKSGSLNSKKQVPLTLTRSEAHDYEKKIQDVSEKSEILMSKLKTSTDQKMKILQRLKDCEEDNDRMRDQIARQASNNHRSNEENSILNSRVNELTNGTKTLNEKCRTKFEILNKELEVKDSHLEKVLAQLKAKDETIKYFSVNNEHTIRSQNFYKEELENLKSTNKKLEEKIQNLEKNIDELYVNRKSESALLLEIEHLKDDNVRLLKMLKSTEEFKDFAYLAENVSGGIRFISNEVVGGKFEKKGKTLTNKSSVNKYKEFKECEKVQIEKDDPFNGDNWVPADAFKCAYEFKNKYSIDMSEPLINDLLKALNKIWRDRENKQITRIKTKYQTEVMTLRRKANMKSPFDENTAVRTIGKLKKDLKNVRDDLRNQIVEKNKLKTIPSGIDLVDNALKVASSFQKTKRTLETEIQSLKKKLDLKEDKNASDNFERLKFNEGSFWMIGRVLEEIDELIPRLDDLYSEFEDRIKNVSNVNYSSNSNDVLDFNVKVLSNSKRWFNQSMKETLNDARAKFEKWHYDIQKSLDTLKYF